MGIERQDVTGKFAIADPDFLAEGGGFGEKVVQECLVCRVASRRREATCPGIYATGIQRLVGECEQGVLVAESGKVSRDHVVRAVQ